jgi:hypothetical protein
VEATPNRLQDDEGSSHILGGGKHMFPHAQKIYSKRTNRLEKHRLLKEDQEPEKIEEFVDPIQPKDHSSYINLL